MGQYKKHLYGSTLYGEMDVFYGQYITEAFDAEEKFTGAITHNITALLPTTTYRLDTYETTLTGNWTVNASHQATTKSSTDVFTFKASGSVFEVLYKTQQSGPQTIHVELQKKDGTVLYQQDINSYSLATPSIKSYKFPMIPYQMCLVVGRVTTGASYGATLDSIKVVTAKVDVEVRCSPDSTTWSQWEKVSSSYIKESEADLWTLSGISSVVYSGIQFIQGRLTLVTSEEHSAPVVQRVELSSGDSNLRADDGEWLGIVNMAMVATAKGKELKKTVEFQKALRIRWSETVPENTTLTIRSSSSYEGTLFGAISAPYKKDTKRLRLRDGITSHSVRIGPINPIAPRLNGGGKNTKEFWTVKGWTHWEDQSYMPKDETDVTLRYVLSKTSTNVENEANIIQDIGQPAALPEDGQSNALSITPYPFYLTVMMGRGEGKSTPVVDLLNLYCVIDYVEPVTVSNKVISAVDNEATGRLKLQSISDTVYLPPSLQGENVFNTGSISNAPLHYALEDKTARPTDVQLYLLSEENALNKTWQAISASDEIYAQVLMKTPSGKTGVVTHYQYNGGQVQYLKPRTEEMPSDFTPAIRDMTKKYKYYVLNGWPQETHVTQRGQTLADVAAINKTTVAEIEAAMAEQKLMIQYASDGTLVAGKTLYLPNHTLNSSVKTSFLNGTDYTIKSAHNARVDKLDDLTSEKIKIEILTSPSHNFTVWVSEEKIYNGVINYNDIRSNYPRRQFKRTNSSSFERRYVVLNNDTWKNIAAKHDVNLDDLMIANEGVELEIGKQIIIPPNILLPYIEQGVEFDTDNPFEMTIVDNSVHKKDGTPLDKSYIPIDWSAKNPPLSVEYKESTPVTVVVTRGQIANDKDALGHHGVIRIISARRVGGVVDYIPWNTASQTGDYKLDGDYIDWSPAKDTSREPAKDEKYTVTYVYKDVNYVDIKLDTTYVEETGVDIVWRSPETKVLEGMCSPGQDTLIALPTMDTFSGYGQKTVKDYDYIVEDNDLWVETSVVDYNGQPHILGTLKNRNPKENWFPLITPGFYYLKEDEFYLYSETLETPLKQKDIPIAKNVSYVPTEKDMGIQLEPKRSNLVTNSTFENRIWKTAGTFNFKA